MQTTSVVLSGVGGQGILLASEIIAGAAQQAGWDVKTNEVHGMAQRGGSVIAQIRYGTKVHSPVIPLGTATVLGALEVAESLRYFNYLAPDGLAVVSSQRIVPVTVSSGQSSYPDLSESVLGQFFKRLVYLDAIAIAESLGNSKTANSVLLGAMSVQLELPESAWVSAFQMSVKPPLVEINLEAFRLGVKAATSV